MLVVALLAAWNSWLFILFWGAWLLLPALLLTTIRHGTAQQQTAAWGSLATYAALLWANGPIQSASLSGSFGFGIGARFFEHLLSPLVVALAGWLSLWWSRRLLAAQTSRQWPPENGRE
jgi:hypothetical protein